MLSSRRGGQPDYRMCNQTVTVYPKKGGRAVYNKAFFELTRVRSAGEERLGTEFLVVIPCSWPVVEPGDKILPGVGPEEMSWRDLDVARWPELMQTSRVAHKFFGGKLCHVEAR